MSTTLCTHFSIFTHIHLTLVNGSTKWHSSNFHSTNYINVPSVVGNSCFILVHLVCLIEKFNASRYSNNSVSFLCGVWIFYERELNQRNVLQKIWDFILKMYQSFNLKICAVLRKILKQNFLLSFSKFLEQWSFISWCPLILLNSY